MHVTLHPATPADLPLVQNLLPLYLYDIAEHTCSPCTPDGRYEGCPALPAFWSDPDKFPFVLRSAAEPAGFALVDGTPDTPGVDFCIAEFFVLRKFRRQGAGQRIAHELFDRYPGRWIVEQLPQNKPAIAFWSKTVARYTAGRFTRHATPTLITLSFRNDHSPAT